MPPENNQEEEKQQFQNFLYSNQENPQPETPPSKTQPLTSENQTTQETTFPKRKYLVLISLILAILVSLIIFLKLKNIFPIFNVNKQETSLESQTSTQTTSSIPQIPPSPETVFNQLLNTYFSEPNWENFSNLLDYAQKTQRDDYLNKVYELIYSEDDKKRINDVEDLSSLIEVLLLDNKLNLKPNIVYISLKDEDRNCKNYLNVLPKLPKGWVYNCSNNPENAQGQGWIPINFKGLGLLTSLPIDSVNEYPYIYTLVLDKNKNYELTAKLDLTDFFNEDEKIFSLGSAFDLTPSVVKYR